MIERIAEAVKRVLLPELEKLGERLGYVEAHLGEISRRIGHLEQRLDETNLRLDQTNSRIDEVRSELTERMEKIYQDLSGKLEHLNARVDTVVLHLHRVHETTDKLADYDRLKERVAELEQQVKTLQSRT